MADLTHAPPADQPVDADSYQRGFADGIAMSANVAAEYSVLNVTLHEHAEAPDLNATHLRLIEMIVANRISALIQALLPPGSDE